MRLARTCSMLAMLGISIGGTTSTSWGDSEHAGPGVPADLRAAIARFAPTEITADVSHLAPGDRQALDELIRAAKLMDEIYLRQLWSGNAALRDRLRADTSPEGRLRSHYFAVNFGPWSRLDEWAPFVDAVPAKRPPGANHYPEDMTKEEFEAWVERVSPADREKARGFFHAVRRGPDGKLRLVAFGELWREFLEPAARHLRRAAELTSNATLAKYLTERAAAFALDDYYASDVAWMELDAPIDVTIGPYETYGDELFGYKAAYEAFITLRDDAETDKLAKFGRHLQELEDHLPIDPKYRNPKLGASAPIRVVNVVFVGGEAKAGVQTAAFNLPNDERVIREKGSKRVMLKNVQQAKFEKALRPISRVVLDPAQQRDLSFDAFFTHILAHELMHGLGPHDIRAGERTTTVRKELQELYSAIEEAKADATGLWALQHLIDTGAVEKSLERPMYVTFLASMFRSVRFGVDEAHGRGVALQFNYLSDRGAITHDAAAGTFAVDFAKVRDGVAALTRDLLTLEAEGGKAAAQAMLDRYAVVRPEMRQALDKLAGVPVDIEPIFPLAR